MNKYIEYIRSQLDKRTLLEQLAEESAELTQASLKLIRSEKLSNNFTPVSIDEAFENLKEEVIDVLIAVHVLIDCGLREDEITLYKLRRWAERLGYEDE